MGGALNRAALHAWANTIKQHHWVFRDNFAVGPYHHYMALMASLVPSRRNLDLGSSRPVDLGLHFLYCLQSNQNLGNDGYDNYQAPCVGTTEMFARRMWVKGSLEYYGTASWGEGLVCTEKVGAVRTVGSSVFVTTSREFTGLLRESRSLVYTNEPFTPSFTPSSTTGKINNDGGSLCDTVITPTAILKYSMLTYNLHKIHLDRTYALAENLPNIVVQGPLMVSLLLFWFDQLHNLPVKSFHYRNSNVCFAGDPVSLRCDGSDKKYTLTITNQISGQTYITGTIITK